MYENRFIKNAACPKCREEGKDKHGDNLATYSDGSSYCWSCGFSDMGNSHIVRFLDKRNRDISNEGIRVVPRITLPSDAVTDYPDRVVEWLGQYNLDRLDMIKNGLLWSDAGININVKGIQVKADSLLLFPFWNNENLLGWQGRYFGMNPIIPKWISKGKLDSIFHILFNGRIHNPSIPLKMGRVGHAMNDASQVVLVEDIVSAIKVSKTGVCSMPLFGVNFRSRWVNLRLLGYSEALLWLDPDMHLRIVKESRVGCLNGITTHAVLSTKDPKCHTLEEIRNYIGATQ